MKLIRRRIFTGAAAISLVLFVVTSALWSRSYWVWDKAYRHNPHRAVGLTSSRGEIRFYAGEYLPPYGPDDHAKWVYYGGRPAVTLMWLGAPPALRRLGFDYRSVEMAPQGLPYRVRERSVVLPYWLFAALATLLPVSWALTTRRRIRLERRLAAGLCLRCGYDVRATPGRCPECGAAAALSGGRPPGVTDADGARRAIATPGTA